MKHAKQQPPAPPVEPRSPAPASPKKQTSGTERWPASCVANGEWYQLPKVILKRFGKLGIEPQHLLLLLVLQTDRFRNRPVRYYWEELANLCGCTKNTVRRWGYELKKKGLLEIIPVRQRLPGEVRQLGYRNSRNIFDLEPFEQRVERLHIAWVKERTEKRRAKRKRISA